MPEKWTGTLIGKMHNEKITYEDVAKKLGVTKAYISMILNGSRKPPNIRKRIEAAIDSILADRKGIKRGENKQ